MLQAILKLIMVTSTTNWTTCLLWMRIVFLDLTDSVSQTAFKLYYTCLSWSQAVQVTDLPFVLAGTLQQVGNDVMDK